MDSVGEGEGGKIWEKKKKKSFQGLFHIVIFETKVCTDFSVIKFNFRLTTPALVSRKKKKNLQARLFIGIFFKRG